MSAPTSQSFPFDVFLSHSSKDKATVRKIAERLRDDGIRVWFDEWEIKPGDSIPRKVEEGLEHSRVLVLCMSANAFGSDWAGLESYTFRFRDPLNKERRFIPLRLDDATIKGSLAQFLYIDWRSGATAHAKLLEVCQPEKLSTTYPSEESDAHSHLLQNIYSLGHTDRVWSVTFSPDSRYALSCSEDKTLRLWKVNNLGAHCIRVFEGHTDDVVSVAFSPDGHLAVSGSVDKTLRLWEVETGRCLRVFEGHTGSVYSVALSPNGRFALSGSDDNTIRLWEITSADARYRRIFEGHTNSVNCVSFSPDGRFALSGSWDNTLRLWNVEDGRCIRIFEGHTDGVTSVAFSPNGHLALSGSGDKTNGTLHLWQVADGRCLHIFNGHTGAVWSITFSPNGRFALSGSEDNTIRLWEVTSIGGRCLGVFKEHIGSVLSVAFSPDGRFALSGSEDNTIRLWEIDNPNTRCLHIFEGHTGSVLSTGFSRDNRLILSGSWDNTLRLWDSDNSDARCLRVFTGHTNTVWSVTFSPDDRFALSGSEDKTIRLWEIDSPDARCLRIFEGHTNGVNRVAFSPNGNLALSCSGDRTLRLWEIESGHCLHVLEGHTGSVNSVAFSPDGRLALSGSWDNTLRLWNIEDGRCIRIFEGHTNSVYSVAFSPDGNLALSGSGDSTLRLWDINSPDARCILIFEGHTHSINSVTFSPDGQFALSSSDDNTLRLWDVEDGRCLNIFEGHTDTIWSIAFSSDGRTAFSTAGNGVMRVWNTAKFISRPHASVELSKEDTSANTYVQYINAKVLVVGDTNSGKTGLTCRLATGKWKPSEGSTVGTWSTQWQLKDNSVPSTVDREIWLWDFGGQADQRLIHQLYMDRAALVLLLFNADKEDVLVGLRDWLTALRRSIQKPIPQFLVAGRIDTGFKASREKLLDFAKRENLNYFETSAKTGEGCNDLRTALIEKIPWATLGELASPQIYKLIKDKILKMRDEGQVLHTFKELREILRQRLDRQYRFSDDILKTVIGLLNGPGIVKELDYGTYVLLAPEWINAYAQAVIRTLRSTENELGALPLRSIADGKLIYQSIGRDGASVEMKRLPPPEERVVLGEMERQLEERGLCLRQGDKLVFPSHCGRDRPEVLKTPAIFISYVVKGFLDDIYATLVVKLADSQSFRLTELWRDAADFVTLAGEHHMGVKLTRASASEGEIGVYFGTGVTEQEQVIFANYIHAHLKDEHISEQAERLRHYVCPHCHTPKGNAEVLMKKLIEKKQAAEVTCDNCDRRFALWDRLEQLFASEAIRKQVEGLRADDLEKLTTRRKGKLLVLEVGARITSANQKWYEIPQEEDDGIDIMVEFTDDDGNGLGKGLCLQLKAGNSHLSSRKKDGAEIFAIKDQRWVHTWTHQPHPVMLVVGTFEESDRDDRLHGSDKLQFADVRWMEISSVLKQACQNGTKPVKQIEFKGERLDITSIRRIRDQILGQASKG